MAEIFVITFPDAASATEFASRLRSHIRILPGREVASPGGTAVTFQVLDNPEQPGASAREIALYLRDLKKRLLRLKPHTGVRVGLGSASSDLEEVAPPALLDWLAQAGVANGAAPRRLGFEGAAPQVRPSEREAPSTDLKPTAADATSPATPRYLNGKMPRRVRCGEEASLRVSIGRREGEGSAALPTSFHVPPGGADVILRLEYSGFTPLNGTQLTLRVPQEGDSGWDEFRLKATEEGDHTLRVSAYWGAAYLGMLSLRTTVSASGGTSEDAIESAAIADRTPDDREITLRVGYKPSEGRYEFQVLSSVLGYTDLLYSRHLGRSPDAAVADLVGMLSAQARNLTRYTAYEARRWLQGRGAQLWSELIPRELQDWFWEHKERFRRINILSQGDPIPWEFMLPFSKDVREPRFLAEGFHVTRWLTNLPAPPERLDIQIQPVLVLPTDSAPDAAQQEIKALEERFGGARVVRTLTQLLQILDERAFGLLHFASHNSFESDTPTSSYVQMDRHFDQTFVGPTYHGYFRLRSPLVFMNACRSDAFAFDITRPVGWARCFLAAGAGAFIGSLWEIRDQTATRFALAFYDLASGGKPLGEALQEARRSIGEDEADPTGLAYTVYGNPAARLVL